MNRKDEFEAMIKELNQPAPGLEATLDRAYKKKRKRSTQMIVRPLAGLAACFVVFVLLVNFCAPVAYACSLVPGLRELAEAVTFSRSLTDAVENEYVQPMDLSQTENDITAEIAYLIVDQKQVNVFYRLDSDHYDQLAADTDVALAENHSDPSCGWSSTGFDAANGQLRCLSIDFVEGDVPDRLVIGLNVFSNQVGAAQNEFADDIHDTKYLADFEFLLEFDPKYTATGKVYPVDQTVMLEGQAITVTDIEVYPTHIRVDIAESDANTAWLKDLYFYIETDWGMKFEPVSSGLTATGSADSPSMVSYRADSTYFYQANHLKLVITGAKWLRKDMQTTYVNLATGETGELPEGAEFICAEREGNGWVLSFHGAFEEDRTMHQHFDRVFYDRDGNEYTITTWSNRYAAWDENRNPTRFLDQFPLESYPYDEVWLCPQYSHYWTAEDLIVITIQ